MTFPNAGPETLKAQLALAALSELRTGSREAAAKLLTKLSGEKTGLSSRFPQGLHGKGIERENVDYTVSTLTGTVWR